jgi:hypothetical protein
MSFFVFIGFNLPQITCPNVWINYNVVVHLPQGHGILLSETGNPKVYILFQYPILLLQILFMSQVAQNSTVSIVTYCQLDGLGFKCWWGQEFLDPPRPALRPNHPPVQWVPGLFPGDDVARVWHWPPAPSSVEVMHKKSYTSTSLHASLACNAVAYRTGGLACSNPPKFRSFDKVEPDCKLSRKCLVFLFQHPN